MVLTDMAWRYVEVVPDATEDTTLTQDAITEMHASLQALQKAGLAKRVLTAIKDGQVVTLHPWEWFNGRP